MREILFRGKRTDNGEWVYGYLVKHPSAIQIGEDNPWYINVPPADPDDNGGFYNVDPDTVGQYTGLTDKHGAKIFEGDIIQKKAYIYSLGKVNSQEEWIVCGVVVWDNDDEHSSGFWAIDSKDEYGDPTKYYFNNSFMVIGNVHDNPELLEVRE